MAKYLVGIFIDFMTAFWSDSLYLWNFVAISGLLSFFLFSLSECRRPLNVPGVPIFRGWFRGQIFANVFLPLVVTGCITSPNEMSLLAFLMDTALTVCRRNWFITSGWASYLKEVFMLGFLRFTALGLFCILYPSSAWGASTSYLWKDYEGNWAAFGSLYAYLASTDLLSPGWAENQFFIFSHDLY